MILLGITALKTVTILCRIPSLLATRLSSLPSSIKRLILCEFEWWTSLGLQDFNLFTHLLTELMVFNPSQLDSCCLTVQIITSICRWLFTSMSSVPPITSTSSPYCSPLISDSPHHITFIINDLIIDNKIDCLFLTETWLGQVLALYFHRKAKKGGGSSSIFYCFTCS